MQKIKDVVLKYKYGIFYFIYSILLKVECDKPMGLRCDILYSKISYIFIQPILRNKKFVIVIVIYAKIQTWLYEENPLLSLKFDQKAKIYCSQIKLIYSIQRFDTH